MYRTVTYLYKMNECLMTPQSEKQINCWVSEKVKCNEMVIKLNI